MCELWMTLTLESYYIFLVRKMHKLTVQIDDTKGMDPMQNLPKTRFSSMILKSVIGQEKANAVLHSMSMSVIP